MAACRRLAMRLTSASLPSLASPPPWKVAVNGSATVDHAWGKVLHKLCHGYHCRPSRRRRPGQETAKRERGSSMRSTHREMQQLHYVN